MLDDIKKLRGCDIEILIYFLDKFVSDCKNGESTQVLQKRIRQISALTDAIIIHNLVINGQISEVSQLNGKEKENL